MEDVRKLTLVPLRSIERNVLSEGEAIDLGCGLSVEPCAKLLASSDLWIWTSRANRQDQEEICKWDICLVHRYRSVPILGEKEEESVNFIAYVLAHLRLINPHRDSVDDNIQLQETPSGEFSAFRCAKAATRPNRFLCDCENLCWGIERRHLEQLKPLVNWIIEFADHWETYYPLWLSMHFFERGYLGNQNLRIVHLFRVMALEALFCTEASFGKKALTNRIPKLLATNLDLYGPYHVECFGLPRLELTVGLIKDIYTFRNKIAHSDAIPNDWRETIVRRGLNEPITYAGQLLEAATSIVRLSWLMILKNRLQEIFSDKHKMQAYLR